MFNMENMKEYSREAQSPSFQVTCLSELDQAIQAGCPKHQIIYNSRDLSLEVVQMALDYGVGRIIVYGTAELIMIEGVCRERAQKINALLHITNGSNGLIYECCNNNDMTYNDQLPENTALFPSLFRRTLCSQYVNLLGFHFHREPQLPTTEPNQEMEMGMVLVDLVFQLKQTYGYNTSEVHIGETHYKIA